MSDEHEAEAEPTRIELDIELDDIHAPIVAQLRAAGVDIEGVVASHADVRVAVEKTLYQAHQEAKYATPDGSETGER